jgi:hypothetical protein
VAGNPDYFLHHGSKVTPEMSIGLTVGGQTHGLTLRAAQDRLVLANGQPLPRYWDAGGFPQDLVRSFVIHHFDDTSDLS